MATASRPLCHGCHIQWVQDRVNNRAEAKTRRAAEKAAERVAREEALKTAPEQKCESCKTMVRYAPGYEDDEGNWVKPVGFRRCKPCHLTHHENVAELCSNCRVKHGGDRHDKCPRRGVHSAEEEE